jgi:hypothetical protein
MYDDPVVVFRVALMDAPEKNRLELFTRLLELNASDIVHGAYTLENGQIVLVNTLDYATMDYGEFRSTPWILSVWRWPSITPFFLVMEDKLWAFFHG